MTAHLVVGWVGILRDWHGLELLLDAATMLPDAQVLIVGDGPSRAALEGGIATRGLTGRVTITGRVDHAEVPDYIAAFDVAVVPDERTGVASPMKLVEYMALGRTVIAPRLDNIADLIRDGEDGLLFAPGNVSDLAHVLQRAAGDPALRATLGQNARRRVETQHNWRAVAQRALALAGLDGSTM